MRFSIPFAAVLLAAAAAAAHAADPAPPQAQRLAPGAWLLPGTFPEGRLPDGNTVVFEGASGLIVMDTGRHASHRRAILDFARERQRPVTALINSHWHLDHTSGNAAIKDAYPGVQLHAGLAVERMIREVWPTSVARSQANLDAGKVPAAMAPDIRGDIATRKRPEALRPDVPVTAPELRTIDGLRLHFHLAPNAATEGDVWVYEPVNRIAAVGDLVTLPVPFLDTACVKGWRDALAEVRAAPFVLLVPGHGAPMDRSRFAAYENAFHGFTACAASTAASTACAAGWMEATVSLRAPEPADDPVAREMAGEYVDLLRANGGNGLRCRE